MTLGTICATVYKCLWIT